MTNSILFVHSEETITQESITRSLTTIKYLLWPWMFYSVWFFIVLKPQKLSSSLLVRRLSILKILGSNPGISGWKEEILGHVFTLKRAHRAETDFTNIEWFPHRLLTGATTPPLSEEDPIRAPPASTSRPSYNICVKCPSDSNCSIKIAFDIMFFLDKNNNSALFFSWIN